MDNPTRGEGKALLMIDLVNPFDYPGAELVLEQARGIVEPLHALAERFRKGAGPVIYVNDNFGRWRSSFHDTVTHCLEGKGKDVVKRLAPREHDLFVLKPHRSGFYNTPLELLLQHEKVGHLVLAGLAWVYSATGASPSPRVAASKWVRSTTRNSPPPRKTSVPSASRPSQEMNSLRPSRRSTRATRS